MTLRVDIQQTFMAPGNGAAGLAWDGNSLWCADFRDGQIHGLDIVSGNLVKSLNCPGNLSGLAWDGRALWQSLYDLEMIRCINPETNDFDETIILSGHGWLSGVAWDGRNFWVVDQQRGRLFSVDRMVNQTRSSLAVPVVTGDIDYMDGSIWASIAVPMRFDDMLGRFEPAAESLEYALIKIDLTDGREIGRYPTDRFYSGLCWIGDDLWLSHTGSRSINQARLV